MIDNLVISIPIPSDEKWKEKLTYIRKTSKKDYIWKLKNIQILQYPDMVILRGSIAKYLYNDNVQPLHRDDVRKALELLEHDTGLSFDNAVISSIEVGTSIIMNKPVYRYLTNFDYMTVYPRHEYGSTGLECVSYFTKTGNHSFKIYDKSKESEKTLPILYKDCNVIRLEYKMKRYAIKRRFGRDLKPFDLCDYTIFRQLLNQFYGFYSKIPKVGRDIFINIEKPVTPSRLESILAEAYRQNHPKEYGLILQAGKEKGFITDKNLEKIRHDNRINRQDYTFSDTGVLIHELDEKMQQWAFNVD